MNARSSADIAYRGSDIQHPELRWWLTKAHTLDWRFARTMADTPHSYVVRDKTLCDPDFTRAVRVIRRFGRPGKFYGRTLIYLIVDGVKWWTMGEPLEDCMIINTTTDLRAYGDQDAPDTLSHHPPVEWIDVYDSLAPDYDKRYATTECRWENRWVWELVTGNTLPKPTLLDIGAGTGLGLDLHLTDAEHYTALDPSQAMLNELLRKHPKVTTLYPAQFEDVVDGMELDSFDAVISLFGSPSYIEPSAFLTMPALARNLVVLMHYEQGYLPDYHTERPLHLDSSRLAARTLLEVYPGRHVRLGHFDVTVISRLRGEDVFIPRLPPTVNLSPTAEVMR